jgi:hypothetical protein
VQYDRSRGEERGRGRMGRRGSGSALLEIRWIIEWVGPMLSHFAIAKVRFGLLPRDEQRNEFVRVFKRRERENSLKSIASQIYFCGFLLHKR